MTTATNDVLHHQHPNAYAGSGPSPATEALETFLAASHRHRARSRMPPCHSLSPLMADAHSPLRLQLRPLPYVRTAIISPCGSPEGGRGSITASPEVDPELLALSALTKATWPLAESVEFPAIKWAESDDDDNESDSDSADCGVRIEPQDSGDRCDYEDYDDEEYDDDDLNLRTAAAATERKRPRGSLGSGFGRSHPAAPQRLHRCKCLQSLSSLDLGAGRHSPTTPPRKPFNANVALREDSSISSSTWGQFIDEDHQDTTTFLREEGPLYFQDGAASVLRQKYNILIVL